ncbi:phage portal protein [Candidatus Saccharibacteria bacterium]|nr:phage portal protein [Candidatus Saccharibacteria bacterium]
MRKTRMFTLPKNTKPTGEVLALLICKHKKDVERYDTLEKYLDADEPVTMRDRQPKSMLVINNFANYIVQMNAGFLVGTPAEYQFTKRVDASVLTKAYDDQVISDLDSDLAEDSAAFGRAYENIYIDEDGSINSSLMSVRSTIVVYDNTVRHKKMFAFSYVHRCDKNGKEAKDAYDITVWDDKNISEAKLAGVVLSGLKSEPHKLNDVPVIEYANNRRYRGDFERVISGIDAYNILQSNRVNDREKLLDAILAFYNVTMTPEEKEMMLEARVVTLPEDSKAEYILKNINESDAETLRQSIAEDIHKFSLTPDLTDKEFAGNASGVALEFKLIAFILNLRNKERSFEQALMERFKIYNGFFVTKSQMKAIPVSEVDVLFKRTMPRNDFETSRMIANLEGMVDKATLISQLSFIQDGEEIAKLADAEGAVEAGSYGTGGAAERTAE